MTREEAIKMLNYLATETTGDLADKQGEYAEFLVRVIDALNMAIAALREQNHFREVTKKTNADHIRSMTDEELAELLCTADWCESCDQVREDGTCRAMDLGGPLNQHCVAAGLRWLKQPYEN